MVTCRVSACPLHWTGYLILEQCTDVPRQAATKLNKIRYQQGEKCEQMNLVDLAIIMSE